MVNVGGPSKGCLTCIRRKIRCDRQRPTCGQCIRSARSCGGYRDTLDTMFRDQTQMLRARVAPSLEQDQAVGPLDYQQSSAPTRSIAVTQSAESTSHGASLVRSPRLNAEQGLIDFFANNFTCSDANRGTNLFWIPDDFDDLLKDDAARYSVHSVGAMALARLRRSAHYYREAQKTYGLALLSLAGSWRRGPATDPTANMIAILFLGFFEVLASDLSSSRQSWMTHLGGLGAILTQREGQLKSTTFGNQMLLQSRSQVILNALQTKTPIPVQYQTLSQGIHQSPWLNVHVANADALLIRLTLLQAECWGSGATNTLLTELMTLGDDIDQWISSVTSFWTFITKPSGCASELEWELRCDIYPKPTVAHMLNKMRAARIVDYDLIQQVHLSLPLSQLEFFNIAQRQATRNVPTTIIRRLVIDICATIPIYYRPSYASIEPGRVEDAPRLGTTYWLLWPLEVVGLMDTASPELTTWIRQCLERIYETTGIVKAQVAAQRIQEKIRRTVVA